MTLKRITAKFFVRDPEPVHLDEFRTVFHTWIQNGAVEGLLIDVVDYKHVQNGPGIILIGDRVDYGLDLNAGRPGMLLRRKYREQPDLPLQSRLQEALFLALRACHALETDPALKGRIVFESNDVEIAFPDRLHAPNTTETFARFSPDIFYALKRFFSTDALELQAVSPDPRKVFAVSAQIPDAAPVGALIQNFERTGSPRQAEHLPGSLR